MEHKDYTAVRAGTEVTRKILDRLGSPDNALKIIHIAGSNGKGSVAEYATRIFIAAGERVGAFTSPATYGFYDQFKINGAPLKAEVAERYFDAAESAASGLNATDFEIQTAGILLAFKAEGCAYAVAECGMGGLADATNAVNKKEIAIISSVALEHTEYLGATIGEICAQKAGIIKDCPAVVSALQPREASDFFKKRGIAFAEVPENVRFEENETFFTVGGRVYRTSMLGEAQPYNAATAIKAAELLGIDADAIATGVAAADLSGRLEVIKADGKTYVLDGAHNAEAFAPLCGYLRRYPRESVSAVYGCLADKNARACLEKLSRAAESVTAVRCKSPRAMPLEDILSACGRSFAKAASAESVAKALAASKTDIVAVCGSFTLLKEAKQWIEKKP